MDIYSSTIAILIHILIIVLFEGITYYVIILPNVIKSLYIGIYNKLEDKSLGIRLLIYYIFSSLYNSDKLYATSYDENANVTYENNKTILIYIILLSSLLLLIICVILYVKYKLKNNINWKIIIYTVIISIVLIGIYELIFILYIYYNIKTNDDDLLFQIMNNLYNKYYDPSKNYNLEIRNTYSKMVSKLSLSLPTNSN